MTAIRRRHIIRLIVLFCQTAAEAEQYCRAIKYQVFKSFLKSVTDENMFRVGFTTWVLCDTEDYSVLVN